jgi:hypothetical protein
VTAAEIPYLTDLITCERLLDGLQVLAIPSEMSVGRAADVMERHVTDAPPAVMVSQAPAPPRRGPRKRVA